MPPYRQRSKSSTLIIIIVLTIIVISFTGAHAHRHDPRTRVTDAGTDRLHRVSAAPGLRPRARLRPPGAAPWTPSRRGRHPRRPRRRRGGIAAGAERAPARQPHHHGPAGRPARGRRAGAT